MGPRTSKLAIRTHCLAFLYSGSARENHRNRLVNGSYSMALESWCISEVNPSSQRRKHENAGPLCGYLSLLATYPTSPTAPFEPRERRRRAAYYVDLRGECVYLINNMTSSTVSATVPLVKSSSACGFLAFTRILSKFSSMAMPIDTCAMY